MSSLLTCEDIHNGAFQRNILQTIETECGFIYSGSVFQLVDGRLAKMCGKLLKEVLQRFVGIRELLSLTELGMIFACAINDNDCLCV